MRYDIGRCLIPEHLVSRGWTQQDLADKSGYSKQIVSMYCRNRRKCMPVNMAVTFSELLNVPVRDLFVLTPSDEGVSCDS